MVSILFFVPALCAKAQDPIPLVRGHSHNDYNRARPLLDALDRGFCSVEADIFCVDGRLLVAHDREDIKPERNLRALYLDPLLERTRKNGGRVFPGGPSVTLLIDIKDNGPKTYRCLKEVLGEYREMLTSFTDESTQEGAVTVVISGSCPRTLIWRESPRFAAVDGRLPDLRRDVNRHRMPLISSGWGSAFTWLGGGAFPEAELDKLRDIVATAHARGQRVRFWALPNPLTIWPILFEEKVDLLNADDLDRIQALLLEKREAENAAGPADAAKEPGTP